jgi:hypothetical protein
LFGPAGLPAPIVARAAQALAVATQDRDLIARMGEQGVVLETGRPEVLARTLAEELVMWGELIRSQNIKPELAGLGPGLILARLPTRVASPLPWMGDRA